MKADDQKKLSACPDCKTNEYVKLWSSPNELTMCILYAIRCSNKICQKQWALLDKETKSTDDFRNKDDAIKAWCDGRYNNRRFSYKAQWTGT